MVNKTLDTHAREKKLIAKGPTVELLE